MPIHKLMLLLAIALAANLDNLGIGAAYGISKRRISERSNLAIALIAFGLTYAAMAFGRVLVMVLSAWMANVIGATVIALVGVWIYWEAPISRLVYRFYCWLRWQSLVKLSLADTSGDSRVVPQPSGRLASKKVQRIGVKETLVLGVSLALNAMAGGLGSSLSGHNPVITSLAVGVFSYFTIAVGQAIAGTTLSKRLGALAPKLAGLLLIAIGLYELFV